MTGLIIKSAPAYSHSPSLNEYSSVQSNQNWRYFPNRRIKVCILQGNICLSSLQFILFLKYVCKW